MPDDKHRIIDSPDGKRADDDRSSPLDGPDEGGTAGTGGINEAQDEPSSGQNGG